ncbi:hypothetical protein jhhlp_006781 [Lomentospora prolificans]|uniref:ATP-dependent rRNA helicase RRP3 n=1 Tax=Lomentospora prolificans TaxID=41688 RepID=A0A2N3N2Q8_9PEZI|nr:hypothetical protein jhhlp_006781 [Lomentospora prolificans]
MGSLLDALLGHSARMKCVERKENEIGIGGLYTEPHFKSKMNPSKRRKVSHPPEKANPKRRKQEDPSESEAESDSDAQSSTSEDPTPKESQSEENGAEEPQAKTFKELGVVDSLCEACESLGYKSPTPIQAKSIPHALQGRDIIGLAETGSGKTAAFALPVLQALLDKPQPYFCVVLAPTRELAAQIGQSFEALGALISLRCAVIVGGLDMVQQSIALGRKPHVIVATPGRLVDHLEKTKGFSLRTLKYLVLDEADRLLDMDFGPSIDKILKFIPRERRTFLFSATMSSKVEHLQRASLKDPLRVSVSNNKYQTVATLLQHYVFIPAMHKDTYLVYFVNEFAGRSIIIFTHTVRDAQRLAIMLRSLGFGAIPLHGQLSQSARMGALNKFKDKSRDILVATDVAARGLDIPKVDIVLNYDLPLDSKTYIHRVGRTARAGKSGRAINMVTQYSIEVLVRIEAALGKKLEEYPTVKDEVMVFKARVEEADRHAKQELRALDDKKAKLGKTKRAPRGAPKSVDDMDKEER